MIQTSIPVPNTNFLSIQIFLGAVRDIDFPIIRYDA